MFDLPTSPALDEAGLELRAHLARTPPELPCKYFYDQRGSELFEQITTQPEYYPTRTETAILRAEAGPLMAALRPIEIAELGAGSGLKTELLVDAARAAGSLARVVLLDVAADFVRASAARMQARWPDVRVDAVVGDFTRDLRALGPAPRPIDAGDDGAVGRLLVFLAGTIGNLDPAQCAAFLADVAAVLGPDDAMLLGVDLIKEADRLEAAYDDAAGVTAAFNLNILRVINARFGADFDPADFRHQALWNAKDARIEMQLVAQRDLVAQVPGAATELRLDAGAALRTELSCKYSRALLAERAAAAGLCIERWLTDPEALFALALLRRA